MNIIERITQIDKKFAWSFLGVVLALFGFWYSRENPAALRIELLSEARVYDIHADVPKLAIFFDGENIKEKKQVLSFFTIRISNSGGKPITQNLYDTSLPFGLQLMNGRAFPPDLVEASQRYLTENLKPTLSGVSQILFERVVLDPGASFTVRFLVLHGEGLRPFVKPLGKIAGIGFDDLPIIESRAEEKSPSFWQEVISGRPQAHVVRFLAYLLSIIVVAVVIVIPLAALDSFRSGRKKKKIAARFRDYQGSRDSSYADLLADIAVESGDKALVFASRLDGLRVSQRRLDRMMESRIAYDRPAHLDAPFFFTVPLISKLKEGGVLEEANGTLSLKGTFKEGLDDFRVFWRATEPSDAEATERFVARTIQRIKERPNQPPEPTAMSVTPPATQEPRQP